LKLEQITNGNLKLKGNSSFVATNIYILETILSNLQFRLQDDEFSHLYTLILNADNTYEVKIDNAKVESGELEADWEYLPPKKIKVS
jgi:hypothetical protein